MSTSATNVSRAVAPIRAGRSGELELESLRPTAQRAGRLAEALFDALEADVVIVHEGHIWRGKTLLDRTDDVAASEIAMMGENILWVADTHLDPKWRGHPQTLGANGIRFCSSAPIRLKSGYRLGALRVFDTRPRKFDMSLCERLKDIAAFVANECDRLISYETRVLRDLFEQAPGFMAVFSGPDHIYEMTNAAYLDLVGRRLMINRPGRAVMPELADQSFFELMDEVWATGRASVGRDFPITIERAAGKPEQLFIDYVLEPMFDSEGCVSGLFLQGADVTIVHRTLADFRASQAELAAALEANQAILDNSLDVICTIRSADGVFTQVSKQAEKVWGYSPEELIGRVFLDFVHPDDRETTRQVDADIRKGLPVITFQNRYIHKDGSTVPVMWSAVHSPIHDAIFCIARDMREAVRAEEGLRRAQRMEAVGRLTGGVAHDFNNLLTIIVGGAETLTTALEPGSEPHEIARIMLDAGERGADLVKSLLSFSRAQPLDARALDTTMLLSSVTSLIRRTIGEHIEVSITSANNLVCFADRAQLESALLNLAINARDAMPDGGRLTITARPTRLSAKQVDATTMTPGHYVRFSVADTGHGMDAKTLERAMEPYFTTKDVGKGSGLGLSMVYGFASQSGGTVRIRSTRGKGTVVDLTLPRAKCAEAAGPQQVPSQSHGESATILVVEDEHQVRRQLVRMLRSLGYVVLECGRGAEALDILQQPVEIDLLLTDVVMPGGMSGRQLAENARLLRQDLKVLFTTGYTDDTSLQAGRTYRAEDLLTKPYRRDVLARAVFSALNPSRTRPAGEGDTAEVTNLTHSYAEGFATEPAV